MVGNAQVQQLMSDDEILEVGVLIDQVGGQGDDSGCRTRTPLSRHALNANQPRAHTQTLRPVLDAAANDLALIVRRRHRRLYLAQASRFTPTRNAL